MVSVVELATELLQQAKAYRKAFKDGPEAYRQLVEEIQEVSLELEGLAIRCARTGLIE
jgi:hypothetical protein